MLHIWLQVRTHDEVSINLFVVVVLVTVSVTAFNTTRRLESQNGNSNEAGMATSVFSVKDNQEEPRKMVG